MLLGRKTTTNKHVMVIVSNDIKTENAALNWMSLHRKPSHPRSCVNHPDEVDLNIIQLHVRPDLLCIMRRWEETFAE